jgi:hypothetical protein
MNNKERGNRAAEVLAHYYGADISEAEYEVVQDFLTDLRHFCDRPSINFNLDDAYIGSENMYHEEKSEQEFDVEVCQSCYENHEHHGEFYTDHPTDDTTNFRPLECLLDYQLSDNTDPESERGFTVFSKSVCEGCMSRLAGGRWTLHAVLIEDNE